MDTSNRAGTQAIERALLVLREVSLRGRAGWRLSELAEHCAMDKGTTHRIVNCLVRERFLQQKSSDRHYLPGPMLYELGISVPNYAAFVDMTHAPLERLRKRFNGIASLSLRSGHEMVLGSLDCTERFSGFTHIGKRRPLAATVGGIAILIRMDDEEARPIIEHNYRQLAQEGCERIPTFRKVLAQSRQRGYAISEGEMEKELCGFAVAVDTGSIAPAGALTVGGARSDFPPARVRELLAELKKESELLARQVARKIGGGAKRSAAPAGSAHRTN